MGLDASAAAVQDRPIAVVSQNDGAFPVKRKCPAEPGLPDFCLDLGENNNEQNECCSRTFSKTSERLRENE